MVRIERGTVEDGHLVLDGPLDLPNGTKVVVSIEPVHPVSKPKHRKPVDFSKLPSFGMWADREDMSDPKAWVYRQWERRGSEEEPQD
jgi:hypothetical protein